MIRVGKGGWGREGGRGTLYCTRKPFAPARLLESVKKVSTLLVENIKKLYIPVTLNVDDKDGEKRLEARRWKRHTILRPHTQAARADVTFLGCQISTSFVEDIKILYIRVTLNVDDKKGGEEGWGRESGSGTPCCNCTREPLAPARL